MHWWYIVNQWNDSQLSSVSGCALKAGVGNHAGHDKVGNLALVELIVQVGVGKGAVEIPQGQHSPSMVSDTVLRYNYRIVS